MKCHGGKRTREMESCETLEFGSRGFGGTASGGRVSIDDGMRALVTRGGAEHLTSLSFRPSQRGMEGFMEF